jgi:ABC-type transport system involved in multi-copper enzyme maturation permease subunit
VSALLRADWLRLRRRKDLWIIGIAVLVIGDLSFLAGYQSESSDPSFPDAAQMRQDAVDYGFFEGTPEEIEFQIDQMVTESTTMFEQQRVEREAQQAIQLPKYAWPQSPFTIVGSGLPAMVALILIAALAVGDEFRYGTIRTSLLAAGDRRRFLAARFTSLVAVTVGLFAALLLLGAILGLGLRIAGADLGSSASVVAIDGPSAVAWLGAELLTTLVLIAFGAALTVLLRSGALPLLLIIIAGLVDLFLTNLPIFAPGELLSGVPQGFLGHAIRTLTSALAFDTHAIGIANVGQMPYQAIAIPMVGVAAIIAAWGVLFVVIADRRLRTMDVVE